MAVNTDRHNFCSCVFVRTNVCMCACMLACYACVPVLSAAPQFKASLGQQTRPELLGNFSRGRGVLEGCTMLHMTYPLVESQSTCYQDYIMKHTIGSIHLTSDIF